MRRQRQINFSKHSQLLRRWDTQVFYFPACIVLFGDFMAAAKKKAEEEKKKKEYYAKKEKKASEVKKK
jgi:hypothetical protein